MGRDYLSEGGMGEKDKNTKPKPSKRGSWVRAHRVCEAPGATRCAGRWVKLVPPPAACGWCAPGGTEDTGRLESPRLGFSCAPAVLQASALAAPRRSAPGAAVELLPVPRRSGLQAWGALKGSGVTSVCSVSPREPLCRVGDIGSASLPSLLPACERDLVIRV